MEDFLGMMEDEARELLEKKNLDYSIKLTKPPDDKILKKHGNAYPRVIKQGMENGIYQLTVSLIPDDYRRL